MRKKKCFICNTIIKGKFEDLFLAHTKYSKSLIYKILGKILNQNFVKRGKKLLCCKCINKVNKHESAKMNIEEIEREIVKGFNNNNKNTTEKTNHLERELERNLEDTDTSIEHYELAVSEPEMITEDIKKESIKKYQDQETGFYGQETVDKVSKIICDDGEEFIVETVSIDIKPFKDYEANKPSFQKKNYCSKCSLQLPSAVDFKKHNDKEHHLPAPVHGIQCDTCGLICENKTELRKHNRIHQEPVECPVCKKVLRGALKKHMAIHTGEKIYQCEICGKQFLHNSSFAMHNLAHGDIREVACQICGLKLRSKSHLSRHILIHTGEKPHECPKCGQKFAQRYNMNVHLKSHDGVKRIKSEKYFCETCSDKFKTLTLLNKHRSNKCGNIDVCNSDFYKQKTI